MTNVTFTVKTPAGVAAAEIALGTDLGALKLAPGVRLVKDAGGFASFSSVEASARLKVEPDGVAFAAYSETTGIDLGARTHLHGPVKTAGTLTRGSGVVIDGSVTENANLRPLSTLSWNVAFPSLNRGSCDLQPDKTQTIDPGSYGNIVVKPRAHLKLRAGTYYFSSLTVEAPAVLDVDNAAGPVFVNVKNGFAWGGKVVETQPAAGNVVFALATTTPTVLTAAVRGIVVAPATTLTLAASGSGHVGSFFARSLEAQANVVVHHRALSSAAVCPGATDCSALCPCGPGGSCQSNAECRPGSTCEPSPAGGAKVCTPLVIDDGNPCTADSFSGTTVEHTPLPAGTSCADADACNGAETCNGAGTCVAGAPLTCVASDRCHAAGICDPATGACSNPAVPDGAACADENVCNGDETCQAGACVSGTPLAVDDANPCTTDACNPVAGVVHTAAASGTSCSNGNACDGAETCDGAGTCVAGTPVTCVAADGCHNAGACDPATGACSNPEKANGSSCADLNVCNGNEACQAGVCTSGTPPVVDDGNPCTTDACDPVSGVSHAFRPLNASCDDGDVCNGVRSCNGAGVCRSPTTPPVVNDNNPCTTDSCDPVTGVRHVANTGASCDDNNVCNGVKLCDAAGVCQPGTPPVFNDNNACTTDTCDPITGVFHIALTGTSCDDNNKCNGISTCTNGACQPGTPPVVDDGNPCTTDSCSASAGVIHTPKTVGTACDDGNVCNGVNACASGGACQPSPPPVIDDQNPCTADACDPVTGVQHTAVDAGVSCDDGDECNGLASCDGAGTCVPGPLDALDVPEPVPPGVVRPLPQGEPGSLLASALFLIEGVSPPQTCVTRAVIDPRRLTLASGRVSFDGEPLGGARIRVVDHPEFGYAASADDGTYHLVVNGGGSLTLRVSYPGLLPVDRRFDSTPYDSVRIGDVVMLAPSAASSSIAPASGVAQLAPGSVEIDARGSRRASVYFPPGNDARAVFDDGRQATTLATMTVHATEYTVGEDGESRMPAPLPPATGYTYAVELSVDEAQQLGAAHVEFSSPVSLYVDNFLGFPVGEVVPSGYYDRKLSAWVSDENGRIIRITAINGGVAAIDTTGDGVAESDSALLALGITADERRVLAADRTAGAALWRVPLRHFSPHDLNWPTEMPTCEGNVCPGTAGGEVETAPEEPRCPEGGSTLGGGSIIDVEKQSLGETLPLRGMPFSLNYRSANMLGDARERTFRLPFTRDNHSKFVARTMAVHALGKTTFLSVANEDHTVSFTWDGTDFTGRYVPGVQQLDVETDAYYQASWLRGGSSFGSPPPATSLSLPSLSRGTVTYPKLQQARVSSWDARVLGLGGWSLSAHHTYHLDSGVLMRGDGTRLHTGNSPRRKSVDRAYEIMAPFVGNGVFVDAPIQDGQSALAASVNDIAGLTVSPAGELHFTDTSCHCQVWKVSAGKVVLVAGTGQVAPETPTNDGAGDGGPARAARFADVTDLDFGPDGSLYVVERTRRRVRRIRPDGVTERFIGTGASGGVPTDGSVARTTAASAYKIAAGRDGNVFYSDGLYSVFRVDPNGKIYRVFGTGSSSNRLPQEGASALTAAFSPGNLALAPNGDLYVGDSSTLVRIGRDGRMHVMSAALGRQVLPSDGADVRTMTLEMADMAVDPTTSELVVLTNNNGRTGQDPDRTFLLRVDAGDRVSIIAGGNSVPSASNAWNPAFQSQEIPVSLAALSSNYTANDVLTVGPDGSIYVTPLGQERTYRIGRRPTSSQPDPSCAIELPEEDGRTTYCFTKTGRHERTVDAATRRPLFTFSYGADDLLSAITDPYGNTTQIIRNSATSIDLVGPDGDDTHLTLDGEGLLVSVTDPTGAVHGMTYAAGGLLESFTDPRGHASHFAYAANGALLSDTNVKAETQTLVSSALTDGRRVVHETPLGVATVVDNIATPLGLQRHETTRADGTKTSVVVDKGGRRVTTTADGTTIAQTFAAQPGLGILVSYPSATTVTLPSGLLSQTNVVVEESSDTRTLSSTTAGLTSVTTDRVLAGGFVERKVVSPGGRQRTVILDAAGAVRREEPPGRLPIEYTFDTRGRISSIAQGDRHTSLTYVEDNVAEKGLVRTLTNAAGEVTQLTWSEPGRQLTLADPEGGTSVQEADAAGNLVDVTTPNGRTHHHEYGSTDLLDAYTAPSLGSINGTTAYTYDADARVTSATYPDGSAVTLDYDASGRLASTTLPSGELLYSYYGTNACDGCAPGQLASLGGPDGAVLGFEYDGMLVRAETFAGYVNGRVEWQYDTRFLPTREAVVLPNATSALAYDNDADGLVVGVGPSTSPAADRLVVSRNGSTQPERWAVGGASIEASYNQFGEVASFDVRFGGTSLRSEVVLVSDQLGRVTRRSESSAGTGTSYEYSYDHGGNLSEVREDGLLRRSYDYDPNGNRLTLTEDGEVRHFNYDAQDRLTSDGRSTYAYSVAGALASRTDAVTSAVTRFTYDALGNLLGVGLPDGTEIQYFLDGRGRRLARSINGAQDRGFIYSDALQVAAELDGSGQLRSRFAYAGDTAAPDLMLRDGRRYLIGKDRVGSVREVVDADTGEVVQALRYDEFGVVVSDTSPGFQPFGFAGGLYEPATGLVHFGARDYDPSIGRWLSKDPLRFRAGSTNFYAYVDNDPLNYVDPSGLEIRFANEHAKATYLPLLRNLYQNSPLARMKLELLHQSKDVFMFHDNYDGEKKKRPHVKAGKDLFFDPTTFKGTYKSICGVMPYKPDRVLAHEMGHFSGDGVVSTDDGPSPEGMENVIKNENPIMRELGNMCDRTAYYKSR